MYCTTMRKLQKSILKRGCFLKYRKVALHPGCSVLDQLKRDWFKWLNNELYKYNYNLLYIIYLFIYVYGAFVLLCAALIIMLRTQLWHFRMIYIKSFSNVFTCVSFINYEPISAFLRSPLLRSQPNTELFFESFISEHCLHLWIADKYLTCWKIIGVRVTLRVGRAKCILPILTKARWQSGFQ